MIEARANHTATLLPDGKVLVVGGGSGGFDLLASAELYDPGNGSWTTTGKMNEARTGHTATLLPDGKVLVAGGFSGISNDSVAYTGLVELYDPGTGSWTVTGSMIEARQGHTATLLRDGKVLVAGGGSRGDGSSAELYDPRSRSWTATGDMIQGHPEHTATLLSNGKVLVAGGAGSRAAGDTLASAELYDPGSGTWTATGSMIAARRAHTATLLPDGKVLVAGGIGGDTLASAELYDPGSGTWTATGSMIAPRQQHTATRLSNGKVLVTGGYGGSNELLTLAELYDPGSGT
jgi:N-acetylneuraminic acid mutarotase